jgi:hypothetical protein
MGVSFPERMSQLRFLSLVKYFYSHTDRQTQRSRSHQKWQSLFSLFKNRKKLFSDGAHGRFRVVPDNILRDREECAARLLWVSYSTREGKNRMCCTTSTEPPAVWLIAGCWPFPTLRWWPLFFLRLYRQTFVSESSESTEKKKNRITSQRAIKKSSIIIANKKEKNLTMM